MKLARQTMMILVTGLLFTPVMSQKRGLESVTQKELKLHMEFLASDELKGRSTGEPGLDIAARYIAAQAKFMGLKTADPGKTYFQYYSIMERSYDRQKSSFTISPRASDPIINKDSYYILPAPTDPVTTFEGEVVFAGYGVQDEAHNYDDFAGIDIKNEIVLLMNRAPMNEAGTEMVFDHEKWKGLQNFQYKIGAMIPHNPKAILIVLDPKSGYSSIADQMPQIVKYLEKTSYLKGEDQMVPGPGLPKILLIHRSVADQLLSGTGKNLPDLQKLIDDSLKPQSFLIPDITMKAELYMQEKEMIVPNIFGFIEGSDPVLKNEMVIYSAHFDHVGTDNSGGVYNGADDNASGTVALLEIAEGFLKEKKAPRRSIGFLWVSAEEIGLFGSKYFSEHPLVPIESIAAVINLDMISRTQTKEDRESTDDDMTIAGGDSVKVIGGMQSNVLMDLNRQTLAEMGLPGNYRYNDLDHPSQFYYRSDHINFARKDIPVIFYSTGTHTDYHQLTDEEEKVDYNRFIKMTQLSFKLGYNVANYKGTIAVDHPMSEWK